MHKHAYASWGYENVRKNKHGFPLTCHTFVLPNKGPFFSEYFGEYAGACLCP